MNTYTLQDLKPGMQESFSVAVTEKMLDSFRDITGDVNPLHNSDAFAKARGFKGRVSFGMLGGSLFSTMAGVYLPGERCLLHEVNVKFKKPVFIGDVLTITGTVQEVNENFGQITVKGTVRNQNDVVVIAAVYKAGII